VGDRCRRLVLKKRSTKKAIALCANGRGKDETLAAAEKRGNGDLPVSAQGRREIRGEMTLRAGHLHM